jgi:hypothetical protein
LKKKSLIRLQSKKPSKITTFQKILRNNPDIFNRQYPTSENEPVEHYISKIYLGEQLRKRFFISWCNWITYTLEYEYPDLPDMITSKGLRHYYPDIYIESRDHSHSTIRICDIEINGGIHYKNRERILKNILRRDTICNYFANYKDKIDKDYKIIFAYIVFRDEDFLYNRLEDFHFKEFEYYFNNGGRYPEKLVG